MTATTAPLHVVILAAGKGSRMRSAHPKVLHPIGGRAMLGRVLDAARELAPDGIHVVHGHGGDAVREAFADDAIEWVHQRDQLGTGHAVQQALPGVPAEARVLVLYGDVPLVTGATLHPLVARVGAGPVLLSARLPDPGGYGRVVRDPDGSVRAIVEERDADDATRAINEINTGLLAAPAAGLRRWLAQCGADNAQGEYYLTDTIAIARDEGAPVHAVEVADPALAAGVNDRVQLEAAERRFQRREAEALLRAGLGMVDAGRFDLRGRVEFGQDCTLDVDVVLEGAVVLGSGVTVGPFTRIRDATVGDGAVIEAHSEIDGAAIGPGCRVGPFARLRPGTRLEAGARVGNFVEVKNSVLGAQTKVNHLSYIGDTSAGTGVNVGAGTITCNYDGVHKHRTTIADGAFIGSGTELVAPVRVGANAVIGAGTTLTRDAPADQVTVSRAPQRSVPRRRAASREE